MIHDNAIHAEYGGFDPAIFLWLEGWARLRKPAPAPEHVIVDFRPRPRPLPSDCGDVGDLPQAA